jgi:predicted nucleotidyltransferase
MTRDQPKDPAKGGAMQSEKNVSRIVRTVTELVRPKRIILFGSRARGAANRYSDYDIALSGADMDHRTERRLREALDERLGIFTVDLIDMDKADPEFRKIILENGIVVYED